MANDTLSDSENEEIGGTSSSEEVERGGDEELPEYEKQRLERIRENKARFEALRLGSLASSLAKTLKKQGNREGKEKRGRVDDDGDDDEYRPSDGEEKEATSSDDDDDEEEEEEEEEKVRPKSSRGSANKGKKGSAMNNTKRSRKKISVPKNMSEAQYIDENEALRQAIALSLEDSGRPSVEVCSSSGRNMKKDALSESRKGSSSAQENDTRKKRRKRDTNRVQMTEEQVITHFFNLDGSGKGSISLKDLRRAAAAHDFTWTEKEIIDMIHCFDSDGDGKLNLEDFRSIICRLNMIQNPQSV